MTGKAKKIISAILVLALAGAATGYFIWNKPHQDVESATAVKTTATELYKSFTTDSVTAKKNFVQRVLEVSGTVSAVSKNQQNQTVVLIKTGTDGASVNCTMEAEAAAFSVGSTVIIKGICDGLGQGDADLGIMGDVYLVRCYNVK